MMQLIYLGISEAVKLLTLFNAAADGTALYAPVKPTLSPERPGVPGVVGGTQGGVGGLNSDRSYEIGDRSGCVPPLAERFKSVRRRRTPQLLSHISYLHSEKRGACGASFFSPSVVVDVPADDGAGGGVDLELVLGPAVADLHLILRPAVVPVELALVDGGAAGGTPPGRSPWPAPRRCSSRWRRCRNCRSRSGSPPGPGRS